MIITRFRHALLATIVLAVVAGLVFQMESRPRPLSVSEVSIAYWAWLGNAPSSADLTKAFDAAKTRTLFLRAGQFDTSSGPITRLRPVGGQLPSGVEVHLVYNATRKFLQDLDPLDVVKVSDEVLRTYNSDLARAHRDGARVYGLQLDFDVPNRLLPKYGELLRVIREKLPWEMKLSITGLPTWTTTPEDLKTALAAVDFWIPQFYGGEVPAHITKRIPISSPSDVADNVDRVRRIGKHFYAGLAAYGYAILYGKDGALIELRGNIDPRKIDRHRDLDLISREPFDDDEPSEIRYTYRAKQDLVVDGLIVNAGQMLVVDQPTSASLRASARAVRENAGEQLLGICIFRLPSSKDETLLDVAEITAALNDVETTPSIAITLEEDGERRLRIEARNSGSASALNGEDALQIDVDVPAGDLTKIVESGFASHETLCRVDGGNPVPCSPNRANVIRLRVRSWRPGDRATATFHLGVEPPPSMSASVVTRVDDGRIENTNFQQQVQKRNESEANKK